MDKFAFLLGSWRLDYRVPKSRLGEAATGPGTGEFKRALDSLVLFDLDVAAEALGPDPGAALADGPVDFLGR